MGIHGVMHSGQEEGFPWNINCRVIGLGYEKNLPGEVIDRGEPLPYDS